MKKRKSSSDSLEDEINEAEEYESMTHNNDSLNIKMKKKLEYLEQKLEKKSNAFNELKRENLRLKDSVDRKKRTLKVKFLNLWLLDLCESKIRKNENFKIASK